MQDQNLVRWITDLRQEDNDLVGKKCANLGELASFGVRVPPGFALTVHAFEKFLAESDVGGQVERTLTDNAEQLQDPVAGERTSRAVRELIEGQVMPAGLARLISDSYDRLCRMTGMDQVAVAVRSAGTISMPGAMETYLGVKGANELLDTVLRVWSSSYTHRALLYRQRHDLSLEHAPIGVAVLQLIKARSAGVLMTANPTSGNLGEMVIESSWGLGESVVSGQVNPDRFNVSKEGLAVSARVINTKAKMVAVVDGQAKEMPVLADLQKAPSLTDNEVRELARVGLEIEQHFGGPTDIEWAFSGEGVSPERPYFVQARPMKPLPEYKDPIDKILDLMMG